MNWNLRHAAVLLAMACMGTACTDGSDTTDDDTQTDAGTQQTDAGTQPDAGTPPTDAGTLQTKSRLTVNWSIKNVDGSLVGCGTQYTRIKVYAQAYSSESDVKTGDPFTKMFDCASGTGTLELPTRGDADTGGFEARGINGRYDVWISQTESSGELDRQLSPTAYRLDLAAGDTSITTTLYENGGYRLVDWSFLAQSTGDPISCAASGVDTLELKSVNEATQQTTTDRFPCKGHPYIYPTGFAAQGSGLSSPLVAGRYTFTISAWSNNTRVGTSPPETEQVVEDHSRVNTVHDTHFITITTR
jgi:hypothetical protein